MTIKELISILEKFDEDLIVISKDGEKLFQVEQISITSGFLHNEYTDAVVIG